eukprot:SAG22_NODE_568_length_9030_cov_2.503527_6_plen_48_part_00
MYNPALEPHWFLFNVSLISYRMRVYLALAESSSALSTNFSVRINSVP